MKWISREAWQSWIFIIRINIDDGKAKMIVEIIEKQALIF